MFAEERVQQRSGLYLTAQPNIALEKEPFVGQLFDEVIKFRGFPIGIISDVWNEFHGKKVKRKITPRLGHC